MNDTGSKGRRDGMPTLSAGLVEVLNWQGRSYGPEGARRIRRDLEHAVGQELMETLLTATTPLVVEAEYRVTDGGIGDLALPQRLHEIQLWLKPVERLPVYVERYLEVVEPKVEEPKTYRWGKIELAPEKE